MQNKDYFKFFYADTQKTEAYNFQKETGWTLIWASDNQGLNGDTYVVYRNILDLPDWLQAYAKGYIRDHTGQ